MVVLEARVEEEARDNKAGQGERAQTVVQRFVAMAGHRGRVVEVDKAVMEVREVKGVKEVMEVILQ
jgi:osmotically-inducible protein OsmY